jgi:hemolysin D
MSTASQSAFGELVARYAGAFAHAWRERRVLDGPGFRRHEAAFLPAALALQESPVSPLPRVAMWVLIAFALVAVSWASAGKIDIVATAQGKIVPDERVKTIQPLDRAVVKAIYVLDGQHVRAGDVLVELDAVVSRAERDRIVGDLSSAQLQVQRARGLLAGIQSGRLPQLAAVADETAAQAQSLMVGQLREYTAKVAKVEAAIVQRQAEHQSTAELVHKLEQTAPLAHQIAENYRDLLASNFVARQSYLEKEQARIEQEGDLAAQRSRLHELDAALVAARAEREALLSETRRVTLDSLNGGLEKAASLKQELLKAESHTQQTRLTAPVNGTVQQLAIHTVGGVVTEAQPLMVVVPQDNPLEVEAFLENKDIGFVTAGQEAQVKVDTFQYTKYGTIHAKVISVSHDAIEDTKRGLVYVARVRLDRATMDVDGGRINLSPGMAVSVEIKTGKRRLIEYFLSPLLQYRNESLRER